MAHVGQLCVLAHALHSYGRHKATLCQRNAVLQGPEELHSPVETNIFLLAPAESSC